MGNSPNWLELPPELTASILLHLGHLNILMNARKVCQTWHRICSDPTIWQIVHLRHSGHIHPLKLKNLIKKAVDLSYGQLIELHIVLLCNFDNLLGYISDRSSQLRRLYLFSSSNITSEELSEMLERLPFFEEVQLNCIFHFKNAIEIAGRCFPKLKSLKLINTLYRHPKMGCDEDALAIAENMPGLRHLELCGPNMMTSDGLLAILENCPRLESLDVWHSVANIEPDLVRSLSQQIKDLRLSYESCEDSDADNSENLNEDDLYDELLDFYTDDETDDLDEDEDDYSGLSDTNTNSDAYDDSEFSDDSDRFQLS